jgi:uncharacterized protein (TIGR03083 family)
LRPTAGRIARSTSTPDCRKSLDRVTVAAVRIDADRKAKRMVDDQDLAGLDPYDLMAAEADRMQRHFATLGADDWSQPTRCAGWNVRDLLGHLAATEVYNRACLDGTVQQFLAGIGAKGATDLATANDIGIRELADLSSQEVLDQWVAAETENREGFRARDGGAVDSSVGEYPARWQAFHLAFELATHADDAAVPVAPEDVAARNAWQAQFARFALREAKPDIVIEPHGDFTRVHLDDVDIELPDETLVQVAAARVPEGAVDPSVAAALSVTP